MNVPKFYRARSVQTAYARSLRTIAANVGYLVETMKPDTPAKVRRLATALRAYSAQIEPWARGIASKMLADMIRRDEGAWAELSREAKKSRGKRVMLHREIQYAPIADRIEQLLEHNVRLIQSLPLEAIGYVTAWVDEGKDIDLAKAGEVAKNRANMIARTEVASAATTLVRARAEFVGSTQYRWETMKDAKVRPSHRRMQGRVVAWSDPPMLDNMIGHAGQLPNCRCFPVPIVPDQR
jgi:SPP1 gp7 family putative phage head morphogenesis protein